MNMKTLVLTFLTIILTGIAGIQAQLPQELADNIRQRVENGTNPAIVIGVLDEEGRHYYSYGITSVEDGLPVDEHSIFEIGSISKTFTGILLADMVVQGKMDLNDEIQEYLPADVASPEYEGEPVRLVHLANHTSSLPRMPNNFTPSDPENPYKDYTEAQLFDFLNNLELQREIGSTYEYSNCGMGLLGFLIGKIQGKTFEEVMMATIADPLDMKHTRVRMSQDMKKRLAMGHRNGQVVSNWDLSPAMAAAGGIRADAVDMLTYIGANMGKIETDLYPAMQLSHKNTRGEEAAPRVGLAWHRLKAKKQDIIWHNGGTGGYKAFAGFLEDGSKGVVVLTNSTRSVDDIGVHILNLDFPLQKEKIAIGATLKKVIDEEGIDAGTALYRKLKKEEAENYNFKEDELNILGYRYMQKDEVDKAVAVFRLNVEAYPNSPNVYDSLGEGLLAQGKKEEAVENYKKSLQLNPGNLNAIQVLEGMGIDTENLTEEVEVSEETLENYVGDYELAPNFILTVRREGTQLSIQATGQPSFPVYPRSEKVFYPKAFQAEITFNLREDGKAKSLTLLQAGQEMEGKRIEK